MFFEFSQYFKTRTFPRERERERERKRQQKNPARISSGLILSPQMDASLNS